MRRHLFGLLVAVVAYKATLLCLPVVDFQAGRAEARWDAWQGRRQFRRCAHWCVQAGPTRKWEQSMAERFGFLTVAVDDCSKRTNGYNDFQGGEFNRLFGAGAFEREVYDFRRRWLRGDLDDER